MLNKFFCKNEMLKFIHIRNISQSPILGLNQKWRKERSLPLNPNKHSVLSEAPDYTFLDGRPTPYGMRQRERIRKQREITEKIIKLSAEMDYAVDRHRRLQENALKEKQHILDNKLKPKGVLLSK